MGNLKSKSYEVQKEEDKMQIKGSIRSRKLTEHQRLELPDRMSKEINEARIGDAGIVGVSKIEDTKTVDETIEEKYTELQEIENQNDQNIHNSKVTEAPKTVQLLRGTSTNDEEKIEVVEETKRNSASLKTPPKPTETEVLTNQQKEARRISEIELLMPLKMQPKEEKPRAAPLEKHDSFTETEPVQSIEESKPPEYEEGLTNQQKEEARRMSEIELLMPLKMQPKEEKPYTAPLEKHDSFTETEPVKSVEETKPPEYEEGLTNQQKEEARRISEIELLMPLKMQPKEEKPHTAPLEKHDSFTKAEPVQSVEETKPPEYEENPAVYNNKNDEDQKENQAEVQIHQVKKVDVEHNVAKEADLHKQSSEESPNNTENTNKSDDVKEAEIIELHASKEDDKRKELATKGEVTMKEEPKAELEDLNEEEQAPNIFQRVNIETISKKSNKLMEREKDQEEDATSNRTEKNVDQAPEKIKETSDMVCQKPEQSAANVGTESRSTEEKGAKEPALKRPETEEKSQLTEVCEKKGLNNEEPELTTEPPVSNETNQTTPEEHVEINEVCQRKIEINEEKKGGGQLHRSPTNLASSEEKPQSNDLNERKVEETDLLTAVTKENQKTEEIKAKSADQKKLEADLKEQTGNHIGIASGPDWNLIKIHNIEKEVKEMKVRVLHFNGTSPNMEYLTLHEMLIRNIIDLDDISAEANEEIRNERKRVIKFTQQCLSDLERKIEKPNTEKSGESDSE